MTSKDGYPKGYFLVSIAAALFSIYAYEALKEELEQVEQLRFIFTSPTFIKDKSKKEKLKTLENN